MRPATEKSVVMIAYLFPPDGSAGVYRPLRFVRHLPDAGWTPAVVTADLGPHGWYRYDPGLLSLVPSATTVVRVRDRDLWRAVQTRRGQRLQQKHPAGGADATAASRMRSSPPRAWLREIVRTIEAWAYHPDMAMCFIPPAVDATVRLCRASRAQVIWATAGPVSSLVVAQRASHRTGVPYVVDFRDAWTITYNDFEARRPAWAVRADRRNLYRLLECAQAIVFRYHTEAECYWRAYRGAFDAARVHVIPNGYDGSIDDREPLAGDRCVVLYTGTVRSYRYDTLLQAIRELKDQEPAVAAKLRIRFVGEGADTLGREALACGIGEIVETMSRTSHAEVSRMYDTAHALLVLGRPETMEGYELFAGAKLFEYLRVGKPIVGVLPQDETRNVLSRVGVSTIADVRSSREIVAVLRRVVEAWTAGRLRLLRPDRVACEEFSAVRQTKALVRALEGKPAADPFVPGRTDLPPSLKRKIEAPDWRRVARAQPLPAER